MSVVNNNPERRRFLSGAFMTLGLTLGFGTLGVRFMQFLMPDVSAKKSSEILLGKTDALAGDGAAFFDIAGKSIALIETDKGLTAFSRVCTDLGCLISWDNANDQFICPCHDGIFDRNGKNISGPPPRPLDQYEVVKRGKSIYIKLDVA
ncbi:hypothetical protein MNBD_GAMMA26-1334 [hydrothermal vent metagenome]|uniref:Rieske domain-containing protein n=1 Tax=hydrothermal vent metagenome TaxID=652676 RepID=A0A3B1C2J4_9ZZZZ